MTTERCIDGLPHNFKFLRQNTNEVSWHYDIYFCCKCLKQERVEVPKKMEHRE